MTLDTLIILVGAFVAGLPFLGIPNTWDTALFFVAGMLVIALGVVVRRRGKHIGIPRDIQTSHRISDGTPASSSDTAHAQS